MKRFSLLVLGSVLFGLLFFTASCKKEPETVQPNTIGTNSGDGVPSFVGVRWQMVSFTLDTPVYFDGDGKPDSDLMQFLRPCDLDNTLVFERGGNLSGDNGKLKCADDEDPATQKPSTWTYDKTTKKLRIVDGDGSISEWNVVEASASLLKVSVPITEDGQSMKAVMTWKRA